MELTAKLKSCLKKIEFIRQIAENRYLFRGYDKIINCQDASSITADVNKMHIGEIEINNTCNLNCVMCNPCLSERPKINMDLDLFEKVVKYLKQMRSPRTSLHTIGEPLLSPRLESYFEILRKHGVKILLSTNGMLIDKKLDTVFKYADIIDSIRFSIDGATKETYEQIRTPGNFDKLVSNLDLFKEENSKHRYIDKIWISSIVSLDVQHELAYHLQFYAQYTDMKNIDFNFVSGLSPDNSYFLEKTILKKYIVPWYPCDQVFMPTFHVLNDGSVTPCCRDYNGDLVFGNINDNTPGELINNEKIMDMRKQHLGKKIANSALCRNCFRIDPKVSSLFALFYTTLINKYQQSWNIDAMQQRFDEFFYLFEKEIPNFKTYSRLLR